MLREPGYGGVGRVLGAVPILGAAVAGGIMSLLDVRQQYTSYEAAMTRRLGLEGDVSLPLLEDVGGQLGMGPVELHGEIATLLGGGYSPGSLRGSQRGKAMELALKTSKAFGVSAGTMGGVLGMFRPGGGVAPEHMTAGAPEGLIYSALTAARKSGMAPADIERYLSKIATSTAKMAEGGVDVDPLALVRLGETFSGIKGGTYAGMDLSQQMRGHRGYDTGAAFAGEVQAIGRGGGAPGGQHLVFGALSRLFPGEGISSLKTRMRNIQRDPVTLDKVWRIVAEHYRSDPAGVGINVDVFRAAFPGMADNFAETFLTGTSAPAVDEVDRILALVGDPELAEAKKRGAARLNRQPRDIARQKAGFERGDIQYMRRSRTNLDLVLKAGGLIYKAKRYLMEKAVLEPAALFHDAMKHAEGEGWMSAVGKLMTDFGDSAGIPRVGGSSDPSEDMRRNRTGGRDPMRDLRRQIKERDKSTGTGQGSGTAGPQTMIIEVRPGPEMEGFFQFVQGLTRPATNYG